MLSQTNSNNIIFTVLIKLACPFALVFSIFFSESPLQISIFLLFIMVIVLFYYRFEILNVWVAFSVPWLMIIFFSLLPLSEYSREINITTVQIIVIIVAIGLFLLPSSSRCLDHKLQTKYVVSKKVFLCFFLFYLALSILNIVLAGYVPLIKSLLTGDSSYMEFGVKGLYGFYNAFSNAFGLTAFYLWVTKGDKFYGLVFFTVLMFFLLFMTRQNIMSILVEAFVVYNFTVRKFSFMKVAAIGFVTILCFGILGDFRLGIDVKNLARIKEEFLWLPSAVVWLYSYSYFNILNLDNAVVRYQIPTMDFSSVSSLIPSFLRPSFDGAENILEISSFTVGSFILPIYRDLGLFVFILLFVIFCLFTRSYYNRLHARISYEDICSYSVVYFCFLFSFFENFWFYLPVIFQLVFIKLFRISFLRSVSGVQKN